jgi:hypothetical protein
MRSPKKVDLAAGNDASHYRSKSLNIPEKSGD